MGDLLTTLGTGILPDGTRATTPAVDGAELNTNWDARILDRSLTSTGSSRGIETPNDFFMDQFGSQGNRSPFLLLQRSLNNIKGRIFGDNIELQDRSVLQSRLDAAIRYGTGEDALFEGLRQVSNPVETVFEHAIEIRPDFSSLRNSGKETIFRSVNLWRLGHSRIPVHEPPERPSSNSSQSTTAPRSHADH